VAEEDCLESLLNAFQVYDRAVDVVSAFEKIFTSSNTALPGTVRHFERFPRIPQESADPLTPDFTVLFEDGGGLAAEIARFGRPDESVDSLCRQIGKYDEMDHLPDGTSTVPVNCLDVMLLVPQALGTAAAKRIIEDRAENSGHWYDPKARPCIVQFGYDEGRYIFQRLLHPGNGMPRDDDRADGLSRWFQENSINVRPEQFREIKAVRSFVNDPVDRLYLATHLWAKTFPTEIGEQAGEGPARLEIDPQDLAKTLRERHGSVRKRDIEAALELLATGRLAQRASESRWVVAYEPLKGRGQRELHANLAERVCKPPKSGPIDRLGKVSATVPKAPVAPRLPGLDDA
jgi:hypothetical protein